MPEVGKLSSQTGLGDEADWLSLSSDRPAYDHCALSCRLHSMIDSAHNLLPCYGLDDVVLPNALFSQKERYCRRCERRMCYFAMTGRGMNISQTQSPHEAILVAITSIEVSRRLWHMSVTDEDAGNESIAALCEDVQSCCPSTLLQMPWLVSSSSRRL